MSLQSDRDKAIWTDRDMWKAGLIGAFYGAIIALLWMS